MRPPAASTPAFPPSRPPAGPPSGPPHRLRVGAGAALAAVAFALAQAAVLLAPATARAERADRLKPMNVEADAGRFDDARQIGRFTGNVVITKGSIVLRAAVVEVRQGPEGQQSSVATGAAGAPATFRQKREGLDETLQGEALRIEYDARTDTLRFIDEAVLRRFRGSVLADEARGQLITFDNAASVFSVSGGGAGGGGSGASSGSGDGRVRVILSPRDTPAGASAGPAASEPLASPPAASGSPGAPVRR